MAGDAAERVGVLVVHLAAERIAARRVTSVGAIGRAASRRPEERVSVMPSGPKTRSSEEPSRRSPLDRLDDEAEQVGAEVEYSTYRPGGSRTAACR